MMNEAARPDSDSLMALEALLKFRSDSIVESEESTVVDNHNNNFKNRPRRVDNDAAKNEKPTRKRPAPPQMKQEPPHGQMLSHVTPPFGAMSPRSALSPSFTLQYEFQNNSHLAGSAAPYSPVVPSVEPVAVPSLNVSFPIAGDTTRVNNSSTESVVDKPTVRSTEIEAALKSKPQRGRKRENLSELERLELTRTRNREHAKSTR